MSVYVGKFKLYGTNATEFYTWVDCKKAYENSVYIRDIQLTNSSFDGNVSNFKFKESTYMYLYDSNLKVSNYVASTGAFFDEMSKDWNSSTVFIAGLKNYTGALPVETILNFFPYRINLDEYEYNTFFVVKNDNKDDYFEFLQILNNSSNTVNTGAYIVSTNSYTRRDAGILNVLSFKPNVSGTKNALQSRLVFIINTTDGNFASTDTLVTGSERDSWIVGRSDTVNFSYSQLAKEMSSDIKPDPPEKTGDPYKDGGTSEGGGGGGTFGGGNTIFGGASDSIDIPALPTASASSAGFITLFNPSLAQLNNLANYMWSDLFSLDTFKKIFADPMDCILGLSIVPVKPASAGTSSVKIGNVSTDVSMNKTSTQYVAVDCGTIEVKEYWGAYLDYAPYTQCEIYLPYVGTKQISVDDVMNKSVHVVYHVDILSGACNAYVKCGDSVLYTFVGQCSSSIPISGNDWTNVLNGAISVAGKIGLAMATGGATALMSGLGAASSIISSSKPTVERSGAMSSTGGLLGIQKPYLILTRPKQALPENQNKYTGYPSFITMALSDCTGYTEIDSVHLENMSCTDEEAQEIESLLKSGVIF